MIARNLNTVILVIFSSLISHGETVAVNGLTIETNGMRAGDKLTRIGMLFHDPMTADTLSQWDFSAIELSGKDMETCYNQIDTGIVVENENRENRMYYLDSVSISLAKHYRGGMDIKYVVPESIKYPIVCGSSQFDNFFGEGQLGSRSYIKNAGYSSVVANMVGDLITPDGDTISNVLRVRYHRSGTTLIDNDFRRSFDYSRDSSLFSNDSISRWLANDSVTHTIDKWQWYARGYRYPIVEMRKNRTQLYGATSDSILVAYYYPMSRQESEVENDYINEYYRENATEGYKLPRPTSFGNNSSGKSTQNYEIGNIDNSLTSSKFTCDVYPTITASDVTIRIYTEQKQDVVCYLVSSAGVLLWTNDENRSIGYNQLTCPMESLPSGVYFVVCSDGFNTISTKILKTAHASATQPLPTNIPYYFSMYYPLKF